MQEFAVQWNLNGDAIGRLERLAPSALEAVLREFSPKELGPFSDCNGKLIKFATDVEKKHRAEPVLALIARWNLNDDAQQKLTQLSPDQLEVILSDFKSDQDECNGLLIKFAASLQAKGKGKGKAKPTQAAWL
jgi:hypothetical protein